MCVFVSVWVCVSCSVSTVYTSLLTYTDLSIMCIWVAHIARDDLLPRCRMLLSGYTTEHYISHSFSFYQLTLCCLSIHSSTSLSPLSKSLLPTPPHLTPLTYLLKDIWLSVNCFFLPHDVSPSLLARCVFFVAANHHVTGPVIYLLSARSGRRRWWWGAGCIVLLCYITGSVPGSVFWYSGFEEVVKRK